MVKLLLGLTKCHVMKKHPALN